MKQLSVILIGAGNRGRIYCRHMKDMPEKYKVVGVAEPHDNKRAEFAKEHGINISILKRWMKDYAEQGEDGLASHRNRCGNRYAALHTSKTLDELGQLQLRMAKLEADVARLKKGYQVKGSGFQKEYVTGSGKNFKSSKT